MLILRDIARRKKAAEAVRASETRKASMVRASLDAIITIDSTGTVVEFNPAAESLFGYSESEAIGKELGDLIVPDHLRYEYRAGMERYLATGTGLVLNKRLEMPAYRKDGSEVIVELAITQLEGSDRPLFTWFLRDISQEKVSERRIAGLLTELRGADRNKTEFLATLAHELRGPLAPLRNSLEIMTLGKGSPDLLQKAHSIMARQLSQMERLVDDLMDLSRISRNILELRVQQLELAAILNQAVETAVPLFESARHDFKISVPPEPIGLHADPVRLTQVFSNLLNNACKYTEPGGRIWLTAERQGSDAVVTVRDNGVGIPPNMLPRIFEMFMQVDRSLERSQGGLGIGLTLVKQLVELHGGSVEARSDGQGRGSEFIVRLPALVASQRGELPPASDEGPAPSSWRVLVADDDRHAAESLATLLQVIGNDVQIAYDGLEAVEAAERFRPDVALLDIGMPKLNGYEACRRIREEPWGKAMLLIAVTGAGQDDRGQAQEAGFVALLVKPIDPAALTRLLVAPFPKVV